MFLPDFSKKAHRDAPPTYLVRGIRPLATRGDQRCCVTTCFCRIFRKTPTEMPTPHTSLGASGPLPPVGIKGAALLHVFPASAGLGSAQPLGRKRPTFGPIFQTAPTDTRPPPPKQVRGVQSLATRGDQRCCVATCFSGIGPPGLSPAVGQKTTSVWADFSNDADRDAPAPPRRVRGVRSPATRGDQKS